MAKPYFVSPAQGRFTSAYGPRVHPITKQRNDFHSGIDVANDPGTPIYAAYGGIVRIVGNAGSGKNYWNPVTGKRNSGRFMIIDGPGGGSEFYGHFRKALVKAGQRVEAGQQIAEMGATGNVTGSHLHYEEWGNRDFRSHKNPALSFNHFGVKIGSKGSAVLKPVNPPKPPSTGGKTVKVNKSDQIYLAGLGYYKGAIDEKGGAYWRAGVNAYIRAQRYKPGLKADGVFGPAAKAHRTWVRLLQRTLNKWKGTKLKVDGDYGKATQARVLEVMRNNHPTAFSARDRHKALYKGALDATPGRVFCKMLGISTHPGV